MPASLIDGTRDHLNFSEGDFMPSQYDRMAHLLRRAGFGARPDEIENSLKLGFEATVNQLINYENVAENQAKPATPITRDDTLNIRMLTPTDTASCRIE